jgi:hypothetical protein
MKPSLESLATGIKMSVHSQEGESEDHGDCIATRHPTQYMRSNIGGKTEKRISGLLIKRMKEDAYATVGQSFLYCCSIV